VRGAERQPDRLLEVDPVARDRWRGSREIVRIGEVCPAGHGPLATARATQGVLFRHGGYGAPVRTTWLICFVCWWSFVSEIVETNPKAWAS
jgi:hypothetical protein